MIEKDYFVFKIVENFPFLSFIHPRHALHLSEMESIHAYRDYRLFLRDYYEENKAKRAIFTYRYFSEKGGISSPVLLKHVIDGKRNLTKSTVIKFIRALEFNKREAEYFENLVFYNQSKDSEEQRIFLEKLQALGEKENMVLLDKTQYAYFKQWQNSALRELVTSITWDGDFASLGKMMIPEMSVREVKSTLKLLLKLGLLKEQSDGTFAQSNPFVSTGPISQEVALGVRQYHKQLAQLGAKAIDTIPREERDVTATTVGISEEAFNRLKSEVKVFRRKVAEVVSSDSGTDRVYQLTVQLFPLTKEIPNKRKKRND